MHGDAQTERDTGLQIILYYIILYYCKYIILLFSIIIFYIISYYNGPSLYDKTERDPWPGRAPDIAIITNIFIIL